MSLTTMETWKRNLVYWKNKSENIPNEDKGEKKVENTDNKQDVGKWIEKANHIQSPRRRENVIEVIFEEVMSENFPKMIKDFIRFTHCKYFKRNNGSYNRGTTSLRQWKKGNFQPKNLYQMKILSKNEVQIKIFSYKQTHSEGNKNGYSSSKRKVLDGNMENKDHEES